MFLYLVKLGKERPNYNHVKSYVVAAASPEDAVFSEAVRISLYEAVYKDAYDPEFDTPITRAMYNLGMPLSDAEMVEVRTNKNNTAGVSMIGTTHVTEPTVFSAEYYFG